MWQRVAMGTLRMTFRKPSRAHTIAAAVITVLALAAVATGAEGASTTNGRGCDEGQVRASGGGDICIAKGDPTARKLTNAVRELVATKPIAGVVFGAWIDGKPVVTGALGEALHGVPATR